MMMMINLDENAVIMVEQNNIKQVNFLEGGSTL